MLGIAVRNSVEARALVDRIGRMTADNPNAVVRLDGIDIAQLPISEIRDRVVVSDPIPFLFSGKLRDVLDPRGHHDDAEILKAVVAVDATDIIDSVGGRLNVEVGERGVEFSGGQRQRLGVARSLLFQPDILLLHEPTSSVDASTEERIAAGLHDYRQGRTTLIVSTSPLVLGASDRVVLIDGGKLHSQGTHEELLKRQPLYRRMVLRTSEES